MSEVFLDLYRHHVWANQRILEVCEGLPDENLDSAATGTYGTIRDTLVHLFAAESRYLGAMTGKGEAPGAPKEGSFPGLAELKRHAASQGEQLIGLAVNQTSNQTISVERGGQRFEIPLSIFFAQAINHGTDHRAHICTILTQQAIEPPNLDVWNYLRSGANR